MRFVLPLLAFALSAGCGQKVDHPDGAADCDPSSMACGYKPPMSGSTGGGDDNTAGAGASAPQGASLTGQVVLYGDDYFVEGLVFLGEAEVSAVGVSGARVSGHYNGTAFDLEDVAKVGNNWFMVEPEQGAGMLTTLTPVDTRATKADGYAIGLASEQLVDGLFVLAGGERSPSRAQVVVTVVDEAGRSISGVQAALNAEITAYRQAGSWIQSEEGTDDSGMIFLGNVPASTAMTKASIIFTGAVSARIDARVMAGATTVVTAVVSPP